MKKISFNDLPKFCNKCRKWDIDKNDYEFSEYRGIPVHDIPSCKSAKKFQETGLGHAYFDGIESQGFEVKHYVEFSEGFGNWDGCVTETGYEEGRMSDFLEQVTAPGWIHLHHERIGCECK